MRMPCKGMRALTLAIGLSVLAGTSHAFDYLDGSAVRGSGGADLASLYAFVPSVAGEPGPMTVLLSIKPFALSLSEAARMDNFTSVIEFTVRMRPAALVGVGAAVRTRLGKGELGVACRYYDGNDEIGCIVSQTGADGSKRVVGHAGGNLNTDIHIKGLRMSTRMRSDPRLVNFQAERACLDDDEIEFRKLDKFQRRIDLRYRNSTEANKLNVIMLALELNRDWLPKEAGLPLLAVTAQSANVDADGTVTPIDRVGRTHVSTRLIQDDVSRNGWNVLDPFDVVGATAFRESMQRGMVAVAAQSRANDWPYPHPLVELMLSDQLLLNPNIGVSTVDVSRNHYMELEWAAFTGQSMKGLPGGRRLVDNAQSRFYAIFARQGTAHYEQLDYLKHPLYRSTQAQFPYMAAPYEAHDTLMSRSLAGLGTESETIRGCAK